MSVLIKGMEMPKNCESCQFRRCISDLVMFSWVGCQLDVGMAKKESFKGRHPDCPLVEVKEPHGRLGYLDALLRYKGDCYDADGHLLYAVGTGSIMCAPTIIEADGKDDGNTA